MNSASNDKPNLIGLGGAAQSGKDTTGAYLTENHSYVRVAFADPLKQILYGVNPLIPSKEAKGHTVRLRELVDAFGWEYVKEEYPESRELMQRLGEFVRNILGETVWIDHGMKKAKGIINHGGKVVITDARYPNEAEMILAAGGKTVRVINERVPPANDHETEKPLPDHLVTTKVYNNGTFDELYSQIENFLSK